MSNAPVLPALSPIGDNPTLLWGMTNAERLRRLARADGLPESAPSSAPHLYVNLDYVFDPVWFRHILTLPGTAVTVGGDLVMAHLTGGMRPEDITGDSGQVARIDYRDNPQIYNQQLRKLECPFIERLTPDTRRDIERKSYFGAYKGVTDVLTKYLWPEWALVLTRIAARLGMTPNMVTAVGAVLCVIATICFFKGYYWTGTGLGLIFMILDTVDGKLARCTITSSWWGNIFDHGIDLIHPPIWWYAWGVGLGTVGLALSHTLFWTIMAVVLVGYIVQRLIEGAFIKAFGMHIHVWRTFDSNFRLITARRNPNMVILFVSLIFGRPDIGLIALAVWTVLSLSVHVVQLIQGYVARSRGETLTSWMAGDAPPSA